MPLLATQSDQNIVALATERNIPVWEVGDLRASATRETLAGYAPDALCVACFARKLPASLLALPRLGALNVHPSLLPDNRGPDPLFWTFWRGDEATGVTIHLMDERLTPDQSSRAGRASSRRHDRGGAGGSVGDTWRRIARPIT